MAGRVRAGHVVAGGVLGATLGVLAGAVVSLLAVNPAGALFLLAPSGAVIGMVLGAAGAQSDSALQRRLARAGCLGAVLGDVLGVGAWVCLAALARDPTGRRMCGDVWMMNAALYGGAFALVGGALALGIRLRCSPQGQPCPLEGGSDGTR